MASLNSRKKLSRAAKYSAMLDIEGRASTVPFQEPQAKNAVKNLQAYARSEDDDEFFDAEDGTSSNTEKTKIKKQIRRLVSKQAKKAVSAVGLEAGQDDPDTIGDRRGLRVKGLLEKEIVRDPETKAKATETSALWGLAKYRKFTERNEDADIVRKKTENLAFYRKNVDYDEDSKLITRGSRGGFASIKYTINDDGTRKFSGIKIGAISFQKGLDKDGSSFSNVRVGKIYSSSKTKDKEGTLVSAERNIVGQITRKMTIDKDGVRTDTKRVTKFIKSIERANKENEIIFAHKESFGKSTVKRLNSDGSRVAYVARGVKNTDKDYDTNKNDILDAVVSKKVKYFSRTDKNGILINEYKRSSFGINVKEYKRGDGVTPDYTSTKTLFIKKKEHKLSGEARAHLESQSLNKLSAKTPGGFPLEKPDSVAIKAMPTTKLQRELLKTIERPTLDPRTRGGALSR